MPVLDMDPVDWCLVGRAAEATQAVQRDLEVLCCLIAVGSDKQPVSWMQSVLHARSRDAGNSMLSKEFPGGILVLTGANTKQILGTGDLRGNGVPPLRMLRPA